MGGWGEAYQAERGNLTSLLGTLAQIKENKKNRRSALLGDLLGIGAGIGGAFLQNKFAKDAEARQRPYDLSLKHYEQQQLNERQARELWAREQEQSRGFGFDKQLQEIADTAALARTRAGGGGGEDASKLIPYDIASQGWDSYWERLQAANPQRRLTAKDFDQFRPVAVQAGAKYGFSREQMESAVNALALSHGFEIGAAGAEVGATPKPSPADTAAARAEEKRAREVKLTEVQAAMAEVRKLAESTGQPMPNLIRRIETGVAKQPMNMDSRRLTDLLAKLEAVKAQMQNPAATPPIDPVVERLRGLPGAAPGAGFIGGLDLSKARW